MPLKKRMVWLIVKISKTVIAQVKTLLNLSIKEALTLKLNQNKIRSEQREQKLLQT